MESSKDKTKQKIINSAIHLFAENGVEDCPISLLTKKAEVSTGSFYTHFDSKDSFINEVYFDAMVRTLAYAGKDYSDDFDIKSNFYTFIKNSIEYISNNIDEFKFVSNYFFSPVIKEELRGINQNCFSTIQKILLLGKERGLIKDIDNDLLLAYFYGGIVFIMNKTLRENGGKLDGITIEVDDIISIVWDSIKL